jgi:microcystin-dependent protein
MADFELTTAEIKAVIEGTERVPVSGGGVPTAVTLGQLRDYVVGDVEVLARGEAVAATSTCLPLDGTRAMGAELPMGGYRITGLAEGTGSTDAVTKGQLDGALDALGDVGLVGFVLWFAASSAPVGFLVCNGAAVDRTVHAALFARIGTTYGAGDGVTTFNLPDLRGQFVRGWDAGRGVDIGREFGTSQDDAFQGHHHQFKYDDNRLTGSGSGGMVNGTVDTVSNVNVLAPITDGTHGAPRTASETRPRNVALLPCIKY